MIPWNKRIYALYKGENFITEGTIPKISRETNKSISFLKYMTYPIYEKRREKSLNCLRMVLLNDED